LEATTIGASIAVVLIGSSIMPAMVSPLACERFARVRAGVTHTSLA
jgi:fumarate hydratase class II